MATSCVRKSSCIYGVYFHSLLYIYWFIADELPCVLRLGGTDLSCLALYILRLTQLSDNESVAKNRRPLERGL